MIKSSGRVLLNAEPFGFGPAAAIASIAMLLADRQVPVGYIGEGHTRDLQDDIAYQDRYDLSRLSPTARQVLWAKAAKKYEVFVTAMDFAAAQEARAAGMRVIIYDALTWYWPNIPGIVREADLYLAQGFFGVEARLANQVSPYTKTAIVPPIGKPVRRAKDSKLVLLNMGGLQNPGWSTADAAAYAKVMVRTVREVFSGQNIIVTSSRLIAELLDDPAVTTCQAAEMQELLSRAKLAIMTPGLGNIYDAAAYDLPTIWLPPANDSQGKQVELLVQHASCDAAIGWDDIGLGIDLNVPQPEILGAIANCVKQMQTDTSLADQLESAMRQRAAEVSDLSSSKCSNLLRLFGSGGSEVIVSEIMKYMSKKAYEKA